MGAPKGSRNAAIWEEGSRLSRINIQVPQDEKARAVRAASDLGMSLAPWVREAIAAKVIQQGIPKPRAKKSR